MNSCEMKLSLIHRSPSVTYILVAARKERATELRDKLDNFIGSLMEELAIDMRVKQGLVFTPDSNCPTCLIRGISRHSE